MINLVALKEASVSEKIIATMLAKGKGEAAAGALTGSAKTTASSSSRSSMSGTGLYYKKGKEYFELLT